MAKSILIIQGHPDPGGGHLCHAMAEAYATGARQAGAETRLIDVARLDFPVLRTQEDFMTGEDGAPAAIKAAIADCRWAEHFLIIYPLWMGTMPALLKAFLEQAFRPGVALGYSDKGFPKPQFKGKSARIAVTMGMPALAYRWVFGAHSLKSLERNVLRFAGVKPVRESLFGMVDAINREGWEKRISAFGETGRKDAR
jgi:putative NADPH-quinone reductase